VLLGDLAFGETSVIYKKLVLEEQKVQFLGAYTPMNRDQPLFEIAAMVKQEGDVELVRDEIYATLDQYKSAKPDAEKLAQLKRRYKYAFLMDLDTPDSVARQLARPLAVTGTVDCIDRFFAAIDRVTPDDVTRAARKYFVSERRTVMVLKGAEG
jgi:zinc protease